jgi:succinate-acetate transporter protein
MTITVGEYTASLVQTLPDVRSFAEVLTIVTLVVLLLQREMVRDVPSMWARAGGAGLIAAMLPLSVAWATIIVQRFLELMS